MTKNILFICVLFSFNLFASSYQQGQEVSSCGVELQMDQRQEETNVWDQSQQQVVEQFEGKDCYVALDDCDDYRRQIQRQDPKVKGHVNCRVQEVPNTRVVINTNTSVRHNTCNSCGRATRPPVPVKHPTCANTCPNERSCGRNPFTEGNWRMDTVMKYKKCIRAIEECRGVSQDQDQSERQQTGSVGQDQNQSERQQTGSVGQDQNQSERQQTGSVGQDQNQSETQQTGYASQH